MRLLVPALSALFLLFSPIVSAQTRTPMQVKLDGTIKPTEQVDYNVKLQNLELPHPGGKGYRSHLIEVKKETQKRFPRKNGYGDASDRGANNGTNRTATPADNPIVGKNFEGNFFNNSVPNDNTLAISNGGKIISCINSYMFVYDLPTDTIQFQQSLGTFSLPLFISGSKYDPKVIYDPNEDRFILVLLNGTTPTISRIIIGFSSTNDPGDEWHLYSVSGDPVQDSTWSDYPAITISEEELFITVNQIIPGEPWQTGFSQSIIWQIDKQKAFAGDSLLDANLWTGIDFGNRPIRNLNPVRGGSQPYGPNQFWLSNRNFDVQNDTVWVVEVTNTAASGEATMRIDYGITDVPYGVPPPAYQVDSHYFDTNDGRWLGAYNENGEVQFVGNCVNPATGLAAVYHGVIDSIETNPQIRGHIIADDTLELGYPNIAYTGTSECDRESMIMFEHTSPWDFAGHSAVYYDNFGDYSEIQRIKNGDNYVDVLGGRYDRWGDYVGIQRVYNNPKRVWVAANYGQQNNRNGTWISELRVPDTTQTFTVSDPIFAVVDGENRPYINCDQSTFLDGQGGYPPYTFEWSTGDTTNEVNALCEGVYTVTVTDQTDCAVSKTVTVSGNPNGISSEVVLFPNPVSDQMVINFTLEEAAMIEVGIYAMDGRMVQLLLEDRAKAGENLFTFSTLPLAKGVYVLRIVTSDGGTEIVAEKFVKE